jgi:threonine synthase
VISTAHGLKFTRFKVGYHDGELEDVKALHANRPVELPARCEEVVAAIEESLSDRERNRE